MSSPLRPEFRAIASAALLLALAMSSAASAPANPPSAIVLRHMPSTLDGLTLAGESAAVRWPVALTPAQARSGRRFRLTYVSAVSVLPDASFLELLVDGHALGRVPVDAGDGERTVEFDLPPGTLVAGPNAVTLRAQHRHRVDCSVAATFELWTRIVPERTGLELPSATRNITDIRDLAALLPTAEGALPIHVALLGKMHRAELSRLIEATQRLALAAHVVQPVVDFEIGGAAPEGLDLVLGTRDELDRRSIARPPGGTGPQVTIMPGTASGHPTLVVTGSGPDDLDRAVASLGTQAGPPVPAKGRRLAAYTPAAPVAGAEGITLADAGMADQDFSGRLLRQRLDLNLPADLLASDYGRGTLDLVGSYAADLDRKAEIRIDVNGRSAGIAMLPNAAGGSLAKSQMFLPLGQLRPGLNQIDIFAAVPRRGDETCGADEAVRLRLGAATRVTLPTLAHVLKLPDLALTTAGAVPYDRAIPHLVVPSPDRATMGAALSLAARAAVTAGKPIPFQFSTQMPTSDDGSVLVVAPARHLDPQTLSAIGLDPKTLENAWRDTARMLDQPHDTRWWRTRPGAPAACRDLGSEIDSASTAPSRGETLVEGSGARWRGWVDAYFRGFGRAGWASGPTTIPASASLVLAQGLTPGSRRSVTTIVTAPTPRTLSASLTCLFDPMVWHSVRGRLAVLEGGRVTTTDAASFTYVESGPRSFANARLVAAGWLSLNPLAFALLALCTAGCLGGSTFWLVRNIGRRSS